MFVLLAHEVLIIYFMNGLCCVTIMVVTVGVCVVISCVVIVVVDVVVVVAVAVFRCVLASL